MQGADINPNRGADGRDAILEASERQAWRGNTIRQSDWLIRFPPEAEKELAALGQQLDKSRIDITALSPNRFDLNHCRIVMTEVKERLDAGPGFAVLDRLPMKDLSKEAAKKLTWVLACMVSRPVEQNVHGAKLYDVLDTGKGHGNGVRGDSTNVNLNFHTDNCYNEALPEYLGLLCLSKGLEGGLSKSISFYTVHNELSAYAPNVLRRLHEPFWFDRQREHEAGAVPVHRAPVFTRTEAGELCTRFSIHLIRWGYELAREPIDEETEEALSTLLMVLDRTDLHAEFLLEPGQIEFTNNFWCGHSRTRFADPAQSARKRHMVRYWLRDRGLPSYSGR